MDITFPKQSVSRSNAGFTMIEMVATLMILALLAVGMGGGMSSALRVYRDSVFESDSASLESTLNTALEDILRYSQDVKEAADQEGGQFKTQSGQLLPTGTDAGAVNFVFTNLEYDVIDAYFFTPTHDDGTVGGALQMKTLSDDTPRDLVNKGAYPGLEVANFKISYDSDRKAYSVEYTIFSADDSTKTREVICTVRTFD